MTWTNARARAYGLLGGRFPGTAADVAAFAPTPAADRPGSFDTTADPTGVELGPRSLIIWFAGEFGDRTACLDFHLH